MLVRLLYASRAVDQAPSAIQAILDSARRHNADSGVTGLLVYGGGVFMQAIEGGRQAVSDLYGTISRDARHKDVALLH
ncbi:MAG TPA: BLUF domain-containing protein, partial [Ottowia sp.]|nr:BLUF domain-containing protein [Ottowia sp.]